MLPEDSRREIDQIGEGLADSEAHALVGRFIRYMTEEHARGKNDARHLLNVVSVWESEFVDFARRHRPMKRTEDKVCPCCGSRYKGNQCANPECYWCQGDPVKVIGNPPLPDSRPCISDSEIAAESRVEVAI